jgi:hypothetical protein
MRSGIDAMAVTPQSSFTTRSVRPPSRRTTVRFRLAGDPENTGVWFGEAAGLVHGIEPAGTIVERMATEAALCLERYGGATLV